MRQVLDSFASCPIYLRLTELDLRDRTIALHNIQVEPAVVEAIEHGNDQQVEEEAEVQCIE